MEEVKLMIGISSDTLVVVKELPEPGASHIVEGKHVETLIDGRDNKIRIIRGPSDEIFYIINACYKSQRTGFPVRITNGETTLYFYGEGE